jgi:hypothetical protein
MSESGNFFKVSRKGYDVAAVDAFVAAKAQEEAERTDLISELELRVGKLNSQIDVLGQEATKGSEVQSELDALKETKAAQETRIAQLEEQVAVVHQQEEALRLTLASATKTRDEMLAAAQEEIAQSRAAAHDETQRMLADATTRVAEAHAEGERIAAEANAAAERIRAAADEEAAGIVSQARSSAEADEAEHSHKMAEFADQQRAERKRLEALQHAYSDLADRFRDILSSGVDALTSGAQDVGGVLESFPPPPAAMQPTPAPVVTEPAAKTPEISHPAPAPPETDATAPAVPMAHAPDFESNAGGESDAVVSPESTIEAAPVVPAVEVTAALPEVPQPDAPAPAGPQDAAGTETTLEHHYVPQSDQAAPEASTPDVADEAQSEFHGGLAVAAPDPGPDGHSAAGSNDAAEPPTAPPAPATLPEPAVAAAPGSATIETAGSAEAPVPDAFDATASTVNELGSPDAHPISEAHDQPAPEAPEIPEPESDATQAPDETGDGDVDLEDEFWNPPGEEEGGRGSFYSRRSGRLPRLGADASRGAMSAALGMRIGHDDDD